MDTCERRPAPHPVRAASCGQARRYVLFPVSDLRGFGGSDRRCLGLFETLNASDGKRDRPSSRTCIVSRRMTAGPEGSLHLSRGSGAGIGAERESPLDIRGRIARPALSAARRVRTAHDRWVSALRCPWLRRGLRSSEAEISSRPAARLVDTRKRARRATGDYRCLSGPARAVLRVPRRGSVARSSAGDRLTFR
jgi:hypothetical protein